MKLITTTTDSKKCAKKLAHKLVKKGFAACIGIQKIKSTYIYKGKLCHTNEFELCIKSAKKFKKVAKFITKYHNYELPQIIVAKPTDITKKYKKWIKKENK